MARRSVRNHLLSVILLALLPSRQALAQTDGTCVPVSERAGRELGCFITARQELGSLSGAPRLYWHIDRYATREAASAAAGPRGTVVESLKQIWLFSIEPAAYRAAGGRHVQRVGPLPLVPARAYAAVYMEGVFVPGMASVVHRHHGVEAWYTLTGSMCLETPAGKMEQRAGGPPVMVPAGIPMQLTGTGRGQRASLVLILQDSSQARATPVNDWTPRGLCRPS
jgi:quercetin dioxygenase-like cupin family protein